MTPDERQRLDWLCTQIKDEKDHDKFIALIRELNKLLDNKGTRFTSRKAS